MRRAPWRAAAAGAAAFVVASRSALGQPPAIISQEQEDRDAVARVAYAEAGNQGDAGLAAVVCVIFNRLASGEWGTSVNSVLNAKNQFEPVMRANGDWRRLAAVSTAQQARIDTIINLTLDGRLPDLTGGAKYFQNPSIVAARIRKGSTPPQRLNFGMTPPTAVIGSHWFFRTSALQRAGRPAPDDGGPIFVKTEPAAPPGSMRSADTGLGAASEMAADNDAPLIEGPR